jgi:hypothetical protein
MLICSVSVTARAQDENALFKSQFGQAIAIGRTGDIAKLRTDAAERLADLTSGIDGNRVDKKALADLVSLLHRPEELVRLWVAVALGNLGPYAKTAIPDLKQLLPEADCVVGDITSADAIRYALARMGTTPPRPGCGHPEANDAFQAAACKDNLAGTKWSNSQDSYRRLRAPCSTHGLDRSG